MHIGAYRLVSKSQCKKFIRATKSGGRNNAGGSTRTSRRGDVSIKFENRPNRYNYVMPSLDANWEETGAWR